MGKKKATRSRVMRPLLEEHISNHNIFARQLRRDSYTKDSRILEAYCISFGTDEEWFAASSPIQVIVTVKKNSDIDFHFVMSRSHVLDRTHAAWFKEELKEIIVMHKMGAYQSELDDHFIPDGHETNGTSRKELAKSLRNQRRFKK